MRQLDIFESRKNAVAVSLYDVTGNMLRPWAQAGFECHSFDIQNKGHFEKVGLGSISYNFADLRNAETVEKIMSLKPVFISSFTPCDDLTCAGSRHWAAKKAKNPNFLAEALDLAMVAPFIAEKLNTPYMVENPVGRLASLWRKPDYYFNPCDFGGYLPENDIHPQWPEIYPPRDAYNKKTCIWSGCGFVFPKLKYVAPESLENPGWSKLGGKSLRTKNIRSATPRGFALAVFEANAKSKLRG